MKEHLTIKNAGICLLGLIILTITIFIISNYIITKEFEARQKADSAIILEAISTYEKWIYSFPKVILLNESSNNETNIDSLRYAVAESFRNGTYDSSFSEYSYLVLPEEPTSDGYYRLSENQFNQIKGNSIYLTSRVAEALESTGTEVNNHLAKINHWLSIWLAALAIIGVLWPFFVHFQTQREVVNKIDQNKIMAEDAKKSTDAIRDIAIENKKITTSNQINLTLFDSLSGLDRLVHYSNRINLSHEKKVKYLKKKFETIGNNFQKIISNKIEIKDNNFLKSFIINLRDSISSLIIILNDKELFKPLAELGNDLDQIMVDESITDERLTYIDKAIKDFNDKIQTYDG